MKYRFGSFELDSAERRLIRGGRELHLQPKTFDTLVFLVENRGRLVAKDDLMDHLWPDQVVTEHSLTRSIREVRKALGDRPAQSEYVETVPKSGYRFVADVSEIREGPADTGHFLAGGPRKSRQAWIAAAIVVLLVGITIWLGWQRPAPSGQAGTPVLAILPFGNLTDESDNDLVMRGVVEDVRARLATSGQLALTSGVSAGALQSLDPQHDRWPELLEADWLLSGQMDSAAKYQFVTLELTSATEGVAWEEEIRIRSGDLIGVAEKIARKVAQTLELNLPAAPRYLTMAADVDSINAHHTYLMARGLLAQRNPANVARAVQLLHEVLELKPDHADALAALGIAYILSPDQYYPIGVAGERANELFDQAIDINPELALAWAGKALLVLVRDGDLDEQRRYIERALELNPFDADALGWAANLAGSEGRIIDAFNYFNRALAVDPLHVTVSGNLSFNLARQGRYDQAEALLATTRSRLGDQPMLVYFEVSIDTAQGKLRSALERSQQAVLDWPDSMFFAGQLATAYARLQMKEEAAEWVDYARDLPGQDEQRFGAALFVWSAFGDKERLADQLETMLAHPDFNDEQPTQSAPAMLGNLIEGYGQLADCAMVERLFGYRFPSLDALEGRRGTFAPIAHLAHWLAWCLQADGRGDEARPWLEMVAGEYAFMRTQGLGDATPAMLVEAQNQLLLGDPEASLRTLESMVEIGWLDQGSLVHDPRWSGLRDNPGFVRLTNTVVRRTSELRDGLRRDGVVAAFRESLAGRPETAD